jgi:UTP--glucose-1-phosphate uridylyltransferase
MTKMVRKAVIPAAGLGTRFLPATKAQPKEMLQVVDRPAIQYVVEEAVRAGIDDILIITGRGKRSLEDHFDRSIELEVSLEASGKHELLAEVRGLADLADIHYVRQGEALGLGHAVHVAQKHVGDEPFVVMLGDDIMDERSTVLSDMISVYAETGSSVVAFKSFPAEEISSYGCADAEPTETEGLVRLRGLVEKPKPEDAPSDLAIIGRYVLPPEIFQILAGTAADARGEIQLTDAMRMLRARRPMYAVEFEGRRYDTGDKLGFLKATVEFALARPDLSDEFRAYLKSLNF